mmetsp:Transcript_26951/g.59218  ORF Transcript_26951/g.59218 Transcript_26951/m.59218 type:complete len:225 (-) Transcript_26951:2180-2854(-)
MDSVDTFWIHAVQTELLNKNIFSPERCSDGDKNQHNRSKCNTKEEESTNETFSNTSRRNIHDAIFSRFDSGNKSKSHSANQITVKNLNGSENNLVILCGSTLESADNSKKNRKTLCIIDRCVDHENLSKVVPNNPTFLDSRKNSCEIIIGQNHLSSFAGDISTLQTHGNTHISGLKGRSVVNTISSHTSNLTLRLQSLHNSNLVRRRRTSENIIRHDSLLDFII